MNDCVEYSFPKSARLCKRKEFLAVGKDHHSSFGRFIIVDIKKTSAEQRTRLGITASRKFGKSHERNRFKRIVREAFRLYLPSIPFGYDCVVKPRTYAKQASMQDIFDELGNIYGTLRATETQL